MKQGSHSQYLVVAAVAVIAVVLLWNSGALQQFQGGAVATGKEEGNQCSSDRECSSGLICGSFGCMKPASIAKGGRCDSDRECVKEAYCSERGFCVSQLRSGTACSLDEQCMTGHCRLETSKCA